MSAELINLRRARKQKQRADKAVDAATNRMSHGRTRSERDADMLERKRTDRMLDGHILTGAQGGDGKKP